MFVFNSDRDLTVQTLLLLNSKPNVLLIITYSFKRRHTIQFKKEATKYQAQYSIIPLWFHSLMPHVERIAGPRALS